MDEQHIADLVQLLQEANALLGYYRSQSQMQTEAMLIRDWQERYKQVVKPVSMQVNVVDRKEEEESDTA